MSFYSPIGPANDWIRQKSPMGSTQYLGVKSIAVTYLLWFFGGFGVLGLHRFYLGRWVTGLLWLCTAGLLGVGAIIDLFVIPSLTKVENLANQLLRQANRGVAPLPTPAER